MRKRILVTMTAGMLAVTPLLTLAEETSVSGDGTAGAGVIAPPSPPATADSWSFGASNPSMPPPGKGGMGSGRMMGSTTGGMPDKRLNGLPPGTPDMRGKMASGTKPMPSGMEMRNKMMASGTKPLPPGMENRMEKRDDMRDKMKERASTTKENMKDRREDAQERRMERRGEILKRQAEQMIERMKAAIARFTKLADRVDSRIAKLKEEGVDTSAAEANVAIARTKITEASAAVAAAQASVAAAVANADANASSTGATDPGKPVREALKKAHQAVEAAHKALVTAIESLRANVKLEVSASSSASVQTGN